MDVIKSMLAKSGTIITVSSCVAAGFVVHKLIKLGLPPLVKLSDFLNFLSENSVKEVIDHGSELSFKSTDKWFRVDRRMMSDSQLLQMLRDKGIEFYSGLNYNLVVKIAILLSTSLFAAWVTKLLFDPYSAFKTKQSQQDNLPSPKVYFKDIAGNMEAKQSLQEIIDFFKNPEKFSQYNAKPLKGVLLYGPTGTGKTMLAKATACEAKVPFIYQSASEFVEKYVGVGAKRIRDLFQKAKRESLHSKMGCIIFIDELEAIGIQRSETKKASAQNHEHGTTLNQLLTEMDGFYSQQNKIVVIAATNRAQVLDEALLRPGRFDRKILVGCLNQQERLELFYILLQGNYYDQNELYKLSYMTEGFSGAEIAAIFNEAKLKCIREELHLDKSIGNIFKEEEVEKSIQTKGQLKLDLQYGFEQVIKYRDVKKISK